MRVIHVLRKPLSEGTVASNVVKHGVGGLNIDGSRVGTETRSYGGSGPGLMQNVEGAKGLTTPIFDGRSQEMSFKATGRWPANVILQHLDGCRCEGTKQVRTQWGQPTEKGKPKNRNTYGQKGWHAEDKPVGYADPDGKESVANWICVPDCPVRALDEQSGVLPSGHRPNRVVGQKTKQGPTHFGQINALGVTHKDKGGASRFYKQVGGKKDA